MSVALPTGDAFPGLSQSSQPAVVMQHRAFRAALLALAYPGRRFPLPVSHIDSGFRNGRLSPAECAGGILLRAVWEADRRLSVLGHAPFVPPLAAAVESSEAEVIVVTEPRSSGALTRAHRGTEDVPESGATVLYVLSHQGLTTAVRLSGPGIRGSIETELPLPPIELMDRNAACVDWPLGVDVLIVDEAAQLTGLPRTTRLEILD